MNLLKKYHFAKEPGAYKEFESKEEASLRISPDAPE